MGGYTAGKAAASRVAVVVLLLALVAADSVSNNGEDSETGSSQVSTPDGPDVPDEPGGMGSDLGEGLGHDPYGMLHHDNGSDELGNETEEVERYPVATFDFDRVATPFVVTMWIIFGSLAKIAFHYNNRLSSIFPESCLLIVVGVLLGLILYFTGVHGYEMDSDTFFFYLLPPIILEAGYFMPIRAFVDNIGTILLFAVVGTLLNTLLIGFTLWGLSTGPNLAGAIPLSLDLLHCLTFAALLSAVDPVAVLAVFEEIHVNEVLHIVVFGESLLNDGVTVVLYHMFETFSEMGQDNILAVDVISAVASFLIVAGVGTLVGVVFGLLTALITRATDNVRVIQPVIVFIMGYCSYLFAEMFHLSGILACTFCGITMKKYVEANISPKSHTTTKYFIKMLASVCETIIFMFLGISTVVDSHHWETAFVLITLICCLIFRAIGVVVQTFFVNRVRMLKINGVDQFIISYGGLRGAIAFSLVVILPPELFPNRNLFITTTVVVVYFTNFVQGASIKPLVNILRVKRSDKHKPSMNEQIHSRFIDHVMAGFEDVTGQHGHHELRRRFENFDDKYLKPILIGAAFRKNHFRGSAILNVFQKLTERDAQELARTHHMVLSRSQESLTNLIATNLNGVGIPQNGSSTLENFGSQTCLDLAAMDAITTRKMRDDSRAHHIFEDAMFLPRSKFTRHHRHMLPEADGNHRPFHHKARLHLRHLMSHQRRHDNGHHGNGQVKTITNGDGKPRKNVSFANMDDIAKEDPDMGSMKAESGGEGEDEPSDDGDFNEGGITFIAAIEHTEHEYPESSTATEPTVAETTLPWKRTTGREVLPCSVSHSMPDDHEPLLGEAPSWVNNAEYTAVGSPPVTPQSEHASGKGVIPGGEQVKLGNDNPALDEPAPAAQKEEAPAGGEAALSRLQAPAEGCGCPEEAEKGGSGGGGGAGDDELEEGAEAGEPRRDGDLREEQRDNNHDRTDCEKAQKAEEEEAVLPPPWKRRGEEEEDLSSLALSHGPSQSASMPGHFTRESCRSSPCLPAQADCLEDDALPPLPWRSLYPGDVNRDHSAPRSALSAGPLASASSGSHSGVAAAAHDCHLPWRPMAETDHVVRSPSASHDPDLYSIKPQLSSLSFRISEAESRHSEPVHLHHVIELPHACRPPPHADYDGNGVEEQRSLELESDQMDSHERVVQWLIASEPEPLAEDELNLQGHSDVSPEGAPVAVLPGAVSGAVGGAVSESGAVCGAVSDVGAVSDGGAVCGAVSDVGAVSDGGAVGGSDVGGSDVGGGGDLGGGGDGSEIEETKL